MTLWTVPTERFVWFCCSTMGTSQRIRTLKSDYLQGRNRTRKFQQNVDVNYKYEEFICLLDVLNSVYDKTFTYKLICNVHQKVVAYIHSLSFSFLIHSGWVETWEIIETYFSCWKQNWDFVMFYLQFQKLLQIYTLTLVELQQLPDIEKSDLKEEVSCLKRTKYNGRRKVCVNFKTDSDKMKIVM